MSTATPAFYILNKTGVFYIANGFHIRDNLKAHGCFFRPAGTPPTIPVKSWVGVAADDDAARTLVKKLRNDVNRLDARSFCHKISVLAVADDDLKNLKTAGLVHTPKQTKNCIEVLSDSDDDDSDSADGDYDEDEPIEYVGDREEDNDDDGRVQDTDADNTEGEKGNGSGSSYKSSSDSSSSDSSSSDSSSDNSSSDDSSSDDSSF